MSGYSEITQWVDDNFDASDYANADEMYTAIEADFLDNGRLPLDAILLDDRSKFMEFLDAKFAQPVITESKVFGSEDVEIDENIPVIDESRTTGTLPETPSYQKPKVAKKSLLSSIFKVIKDLFD